MADEIILRLAPPIRVQYEDLDGLAAALRQAVPFATVSVSRLETKEWAPPSGDTVWLWVGRVADVLQFASVFLTPVIVPWLRARFRDPHTTPGPKMATLYNVDGTVLTSVRLADESAEPEDSTDDARRAGPRPRPWI